jgi:heme exporter protein A
MQLTATDLACDRGGRRVFGPVSFSLGPGGYLELRGPNGTGKSSLLRLLAGFDAPVGGVLRLDGAERVAEAAHYVGHLDAIKPALTVRENLSFWRDFLGGGDVAAALGAFDLTALADDPAGLLSQGQRRRLALSRLALVNRPLWLLDEPTVGLDTASLGRLETLIAKHRASGGLLVAATHANLSAEPSTTLNMDQLR